MSQPSGDLVKKVKKDVVGGWPEYRAPDDHRYEGHYFVLAFVYSNKGNFVIKGYSPAVNRELRRLKNQGYRYFANLTVWHNGKQLRHNWHFYKNHFRIIEFPNEKVISNDDGARLRFRRLPNRWVPEMDQLVDDELPSKEEQESSNFLQKGLQKLSASDYPF